MSNSRIEIVRGLMGEYFIRRKISAGRYEFFAGFDDNGCVVWDDFDIDYDMDRETAEATFKALENT